LNSTWTQPVRGLASGGRVRVCQAPLICVLLAIRNGVSAAGYAIFGRVRSIRSRMLGDCFHGLKHPRKLWRLSEALERGSDLPSVPGYYGWYFRGLPRSVPTHESYQIDGWRLAYAGIAPCRDNSRQHLRRRIRTHARGNASSSTLRLTLGCLLRFPLCRTPSKRLTFGRLEHKLSDWIEQHARVCWVSSDRPWTIERSLVEGLILPLNLQYNSHQFVNRLSALPAAARSAARLC